MSQMQTTTIRTQPLAPGSLNRECQVRFAALSLFRESMKGPCDTLAHLSSRQWKQLLRWLDTSGLALYFLDRLKELRLGSIVPPEILDRLTENLADNTERIEELIASALSIQQAFRQQSISFAVLKGFSLYPLSVPRLELRSQLDLDFLIAEDHAPAAKQILEERGYLLHAVSGSTWEFKSAVKGASSLRDIYKPGMGGCVELHLEPSAERSSGTHLRLPGVRAAWFRNHAMPVLSPIDVFVGQGLHLYKHISSEFMRTAHVIEFRRHIVARFYDDVFWSDLREHLQSRAKIRQRLAFVVLYVSRTMGSFAPVALTAWLLRDITPALLRWVDLYGIRTILAGFPGSKLYLLLRHEMEHEAAISTRCLSSALLPRRLPPSISVSSPHEGIAQRSRNQWRQLRYIFFRLRFHAIEAFRLICEAHRWRRLRKGMAS